MQFTLKELDDARFKASKSVVKSNYMSIKFSYGTEIILTYQKAMDLLTALETGEMFSGPYDDKKIVPLRPNQLKVDIISHTHYIEYKAAALLGVSISDVNKFIEGST